MNDELSDNVFDYLIEEAIQGPKPPDLTHRILEAWRAEQGRQPSQHGTLPSSTSATAPLPNSAQSSTSAQNLVPGHAASRIKAELVDPQTPSAHANRHSKSPVHSSSNPQADTQRAASAKGGRSSSPPMPSAPPRQDTTSGTTAAETRTAPLPSSRNLPSRRRMQRTKLLGALGVIAASLLVVMSGWNLLNSNLGNASLDELSTAEASSPTENVAISNSVPKSPLTETESQLASSPNTSNSSDTPKPGTREPGTQQLDLQDLPFESPSIAARPDVSNRPTELAGSKSTPQLTDAEVVAELNSHLRQMWHNLGIEPSPEMPPTMLANKLRRELLGVSEPLNRSAANEIEHPDALSFATHLVAEPQFASNWANRLTRSWFRSSFVGTNSEHARVLNSFLRKQIINGQPWSSTVGSVLSGPIRSNSDKLSPSEAYYSAFSGGQNHRLVQHVGLAFMDQNLACSKCHDVRTAEPDKPDTRQLAYWSLIATFQGIDARRDGKSSIRSAVDRQSELDRSKFTALFELPNGTMKAVSASLPGLTPWYAGTDDSRSSGQPALPRAAFASWISESDQLDSAAVNNTWHMLFGRHLVPQVGGVDVVAVPQRAEIRDLLASQFRAHGRDLRRLASWIAASEAFARSNVELSRTAWLTASPEDIAAVQLAELAFASGRNLGQSNANGLKDSINLALNFDSSGSSENTLLAQPALAPPKKQDRRTRVESKPTPIPQSIVFHRMPTTSERDYIAGIVGTDSLTWDQRVSHVLLLAPNEAVSPRNQELADRVLKHHDGDETEALSTLLWAVKESSANHL